MNVLVACEYSAVVREAFARKGHNAYSCDLIESKKPGKHMQCDVLSLLKLWPGFFDLMIAHPPCTHLAVSGSRHFPAKRADGRQQAAIDFFMALANAKVKKKCIEQPVSIISTVWRKPDQYVQPHEFGHPEFKKTALWLEGLPLLQPSNRLATPNKDSAEWNAWNRVHRMPPSDDRWMLRSTTYQGIADAMAEQWG